MRPGHARASRHRRPRRGRGALKARPPPPLTPRRSTKTRARPGGPGAVVPRPGQLYKHHPSRRTPRRGDTWMRGAPASGASARCGAGQIRSQARRRAARARGYRSPRRARPRRRGRRRSPAAAPAPQAARVSQVPRPNSPPPIPLPQPWPQALVRRRHGRADAALQHRRSDGAAGVCPIPGGLRRVRAGPRLAARGEGTGEQFAALGGSGCAQSRGRVQRRAQRARSARGDRRARRRCVL